MRPQHTPFAGGASAIVALALAAAPIAPAPLAAQAPDLKRAEAAADSAARAQIAAGIIPGITLAIAKDSQIVFQGDTRPGFGAYVSHYPDDGLTMTRVTPAPPRSSMCGMVRPRAPALTSSSRAARPLESPMFKHVPSLRPTESIGAVRLPTETGRLSAGVALVVSILGTAVLTIGVAVLAR